MKKKYYPLLLLLIFAQSLNAQYQWAWMGGEKAANINGIYGTMGVAAASNTPGSRVGATTWTDSQNNFWLFGGNGRGENSGDGLLNDLWKYNSASHHWTWMGGEKNTGNSGNYGSRGDASISNQPGSRQNAVSWVDNAGNFWLFGGLGMGSDGESPGLLNDLWMYSPSNHQWTWVSGLDKVNQPGRYGRRTDPSRSNYPGGRMMATGWKDPNGNLWLLGGRGFSSGADENDAADLNDLWRYSPGANEWAWMKGEKKSGKADAHYGQKGNFSVGSTPGGRQAASGWTDNDGNFWLFGGENGSDLLSDLWKYNRKNNQWGWISGFKSSNHEPAIPAQGQADPNGFPGARMLTTIWADAQGDAWFFGGIGYGGTSGSNPLNNIWKYSVNTNAWTFIRGETSIFPTAVYGSKGVGGTENNPAGMANSASWKDKPGNFWVFGGTSNDGSLNQIWQFSAECGAAISGNVSPSSASICLGGSQLLTASGGSTYEWQLDGITIPGQTDATYTAVVPGKYTVIIKNGSCAEPVSKTAIISLGTAPSGTISPTYATICTGGTQVLTATGGTSYKWERNGETIVGHTSDTLTATESGIYTVIITNGTCSGPASNRSVITQGKPPTGTINPASGLICEGGSIELTANGGSYYEWMRDNITIDGETSATISVTTPGTYSVLIKNGGCTGQATNTSVISLDNTAGMRYPDVVVKANEPTQLSARDSGEVYAWEPPTGLDLPSSPTPMVTLTSDREYQVRVKTTVGCSVTDTVLVKVGIPPPVTPPGTDKKVKVFVPTAFTPNGNNVNDRLRPLGKIASIDYFRVYNRWGNLVFQSNVIGAGWDGRYNGVVQPSDSYTWVFSGKTTDGLAVKETGKTLLIR